MKKTNSLPAVLCMVFLATCLHISASGQSAEDKNSLAAIRGNGSSVRWDVTATYSSLTMTVSAPDGRVFRKEFKGGSSPEFTLIDNKGERLPDGQYAYELRLTPVFSPGVTEELAAARARENAAETARDNSKRSAATESLVQKEDAADTMREMRKRGLLPAEMIKSGTFSIMNGSVIVGGGVEGAGSRTTSEGEPRPAKRVEISRLPSVPPGGSVGKVKQHHLLLNAVPDQVIPDDLIVQGSACIGLDCVNNESFGFDTIRLKENNTRIKFDDTSVSAGFPANDWQLTANDSASGGASKFSIEDITGSKVPFTIRAGAATNSIFVDSTGRLGLRTSTPVLDIHANTTNTPALRLEQNNSGGFNAQTWDVAGNEANFFVRDVTGGSRLPFRIRPGAPTSSIDISASGNVGIGTASPSAMLNVDKNVAGGTEIRIDNINTAGFAGLYLNGGFAGANGGFVQYNNNTGAKNLFVGTGAGDPLHLGTNNTIRMTVVPTTGRVGINTTTPDQFLSVNGDASKTGGNTWLAFSDERLKTVKGQFNTGLKALMQLQPIRYEYKRNNTLGINSEGEHIGFGAQAVQKVIPEAVTKTDSGYLMVNADPILWTMLNAIKEQQKEIEQLKAEIEKLKTASQKRE